MSRTDWSSTARALAGRFQDNDSTDHLLPVATTRNSSSSPGAPRSSSPIWSRRSLDSPSQAQRPRSTPEKWLRGLGQLNRRALRLWESLTLVQRAGLSIAAVICAVLAVLVLVYSHRILGLLGPVARSWRALPGGWMILWALTFVISFPPMIGYSTCVTVAGFVFGMRGWFIMASATVLGSTASFLASRTLLRRFVAGMAERNRDFAALALVLKHDGLPLLCLIRLCPLPYSFANGAISTIPTVSWPHFMLATAIASPKLLLHVFVGARLGDLAENADHMDAKTKLVSYLSIAVGVVVGVATGYLIYVRTKARARVLEAEEAALASEHPAADEDAEERAILRPRPSDISLLPPAYADHADAEEGYRDEVESEDDDGPDHNSAARKRDVFDVGDGETDAEDGEDEGKAIWGEEGRR